LPKADLVKRFVAALIDGLIMSLPSFIPIIGPLLGAGYYLTKDALIFELTQNEDFRNRSIGKKVMSIEVAMLENGDYVDWATSIRRNLPLSIGTLIMVIPVLGWVIGPIVGLVLGIIECILVLTDSEGRRIGDKFGKTQVVDVPGEAGTA